MTTVSTPRTGSARSCTQPTCSSFPVSISRGTLRAAHAVSLFDKPSHADHVSYNALRLSRALLRDHRRCGTTSRRANMVQDAALAARQEPVSTLRSFGSNPDHGVSRPTGSLAIASLPIPKPPPAEDAPSCAEAGVLGVLPCNHGRAAAHRGDKRCRGLGESLGRPLGVLRPIKTRSRELKLGAIRAPDLRDGGRSQRDPEMTTTISLAGPKALTDSVAVRPQAAQSLVRRIVIGLRCFGRNHVPRQIACRALS